MTARGSFDCRVLDLSPGGALVRLIAALDVEEPVTLHFSEAEHIEGVVAWTQSRYVGIRFAKRRDKSIPEAALVEESGRPRRRLPQRTAMPMVHLVPAARLGRADEPPPVIAPASAKPGPGDHHRSRDAPPGTRLDKRSRQLRRRADPDRGHGPHRRRASDRA